MATFTWPLLTATIAPTPIVFIKDGVSTQVSEDTVTPANTVPFPVQLINSDGEPAFGQQSAGKSIPVILSTDQPELPIGGTVTANQGLSNGGQTNWPVAVASSALPTGAATAALQTTGNSVLGSILLDLTNGTQITQIGGTVPLPTGAATEATLSDLNTKVTAVNTGAVTVSTPLPAGTNLLGKVGIDQTTPGTTNGVQINAALPAGTNLVGKFGIDQTTPGTTNGVQVNAALPAGTNVIGYAKQGGKTQANAPVYNDFGTNPATTGAYLQLVASTTSASTEIEIAETAGNALYLAFGAASSEVNEVIISPGGNGRIPLAIPAGTRISIKSVAVGNSTAGTFIIMNFYS